MGQYVTNTIKINNLLNEEAIRLPLAKAWGKVYNFFNTIGTFSVTLFGVYLTFKVIKLAMDTSIHGYALHIVYGWSVWFIGTLWDSGTNFL